MKPAAGTGADRDTITDTEPDDGLGADLSFLAAPGRLADWRMVLAYEAASKAGVFDALPGTLAELAERRDLDVGALRAVLGQLTAWGILAEDDRGRYAAGPRSPVPPRDAMLLVHANVLHRWAALLGPRLRDRTTGSTDFPARPAPPGVGMDLLARNARRLSEPMLDICLRRFPDAHRVLDLGGGHGEHALTFARRGLRPTLQDLPEVIENAERRSGLTRAGVELHPGDFFETLAPGPFDLVLIAGTTNMFDGARNLDLYRRLRAVIAPGGGLAIVTYMRGRDEVAASFGLQMLAFSDGGDAHGVDDYRRWLGEARYGPIEVHELLDPPQTVVLTTR